VQCGAKLNEGAKFCSNCGAVSAGQTEARQTNTGGGNAAAQAAFLRGKTYLENYDDDNAIKEFTEAIRLDPNNANAYSGRGFVYERKKQWDEAIKDYTELIRLSPNFSTAYIGRGRVYICKRWDAAINDFNEAIRLAPNDANAYLSRVLYYEWKEQWDAVIKDYTEAIRLNPNISDAYSGRASAYYKTGRSDPGTVDAMINDNTEALRLDPDNEEAKSFFQYFQSQMQQTTAVRSEAEILNSIQSYYEYGNHDMALMECNEGIQLYPNNVVLYTARGATYCNLGKHMQARADVNKALQLNPNHQPAKNIDISLREKGY
jgi:tetratricopeptide (TPR) repeat protein